MFKIYGKHTDITCLFAYYIFNFLLNWLIRNIEPRFMMASSLDRSVPFLKVFVIPYFMDDIYHWVTVFLAIKPGRNLYNQHFYSYRPGHMHADLSDLSEQPEFKAGSYEQRYILPHDTGNLPEKPGSQHSTQHTCALYSGNPFRTYEI